MSMIADDAARAPAPWTFAPWFMPLWYGAIALMWWNAFAIEVARSGGAASSVASASVAVATSLMVCGKFAGFLAEAGVYRLVWLGWGRRLPFWRFFSVVLSASVADLLASAMVELARRHPDALPAWLWPIAGLQLLEGTDFGQPGALRAAFGTVGLLTALRITITAHAQAKALERALGGPLALTAGLWLSTRLAILWTLDLLKGMSPVGGTG